MITHRAALAILLGLGCNFAYADTWVMNNAGGGQIVLTDRLCKGQKHLYYAYSHSDRSFLEGCWALMDGKVHIAWDQKVGRRVYDKNDFIPDHVVPKNNVDSHPPQKSL